MSGLISKSIKSRSGKVILKLYLALVRPHLDYAVQFWSKYYRMDIILFRVSAEKDDQNDKKGFVILVM